MTFEVINGVARPSRLRRIDVITSSPWYAEHILPVWNALPPKYRGRWHAPAETRALLATLGVEATLGGGTANGAPTLVAASGDMFKARKLGRPIAMMEHGAGQSYGGDRQSRSHSSYAGGDKRDAVELFLHPGPHPAARDAARYPDARVEVVGCPKLDSLPGRDYSLDTDRRPVVAVSFHWDCQVSPETRSSFIYFRSALAPSRQYRLVGHGHPRMFNRLEPWYARKGIETERSFTEVLKKADLYVCDNSSSMFEFASTGRPVVVLNPPYYRRGISHGLRFWDAADVGLSVSKPYDLNAVILKALQDPTQARVNRAAALDMVYSHRDGTSAERAASALVDWVTSR